MLQCYVLMRARPVTAFLAPPRSQRLGQGPRSPHLKAGPGQNDAFFDVTTVGTYSNPKLKRLSFHWTIFLFHCENRRWKKLT
jgi:hypothetical protein